MTATEEPRQFACEGSRLNGILHRPARASGRAVLMIVGGPQYRVGAHRLYVIIARTLAAQGCTVLRFDHRGVGDSEGERPGFERLDADIRCGIDELLRSAPGTREVILCGLCDGASAALLYAAGDERVTGLALLNPWARSEVTLARSFLRHYYVARLFSRGFWEKLISGELDLRRSLVSFLATVKSAFRPSPGGEHAPGRGTGEEASAAAPVRRLAAALGTFRGSVLLVYSGRDMTALEFRDAVEATHRRGRHGEGPRLTSVELAGADHTFSHRRWREELLAHATRFLGAP